MKTVIKAENVSKAYQIGQFTTGTLSRDIERWFYKIRGKEDPFLKIGEENNRTVKSKSNIVWSLSDINFEINQGEAVGIIGRNGAGKSTLLKLLSQITSPTKGSIKIKGRIASLLEVGTGFHPELTGRENIFLNGAILGMKKYEITQKFDQIVDFSGVEKYIDTPVKRYSSGMYVRLAFAVAAHLESEILIVDEVLAVGDNEFQKKCLGKMEEIGKSYGRTVLFVSHNMRSISNLCHKSIYLQNGRLKNFDQTSIVINEYLNSNNNESLSISNFRTSGGKIVEIINIIKDKDIYFHNEFITFSILIKSNSKDNLNKLSLSLCLFDNEQNIICNSQSNYFQINANEEKNLKLTFKSNHHLMPGKYKVGVNLLNGSMFTSYESYDRIVGFPELEIFSNEKSKESLSLSNWNQGWGSIYFESEII